MGLAALGISAYMLTSTSGKENEKFVYKALEKGEDDLKILYVTPEKVSKSKRFMSKLEKCHHAGRLSLISIDVSLSWFKFLTRDFLPCHLSSRFPALVYLDISPQLIKNFF